jgi:hypothetical protein
MKNKYYSDGGERVYDKSWWADQAADAGMPVVVELQKREKGGDCLWCSIDGEFVYTHESCGLQCRDYDPRNGKSGCCRNASQGFIGTGKYYSINEQGRAVLAEQTATQT